MGEMEKDRGGRAGGWVGNETMRPVSDREHRKDVKKLWWLKVRSPARWAEPPTWVI